MKKHRIWMIILLAVCLMFTSVCCFQETVYARAITTFRQAEKLAKKQVKNAAITEVDKDYEKGILVYEIQMIKGKKKYDLTYRAADSKMISYGWEIQSRYIKRGSGKVIGTSKCRELARKQVSNGTITSIVRKFSDGIEIYKVKMKKGSKAYEMKFHARTGKLLEYDWEIITETSNSGNKYIGAEKAKKIALQKVGGGTVVKVEFDMDDGVPVYEVEIIMDEYEYEIKIHAKSGKILEYDMDSIYD